MSTLDEITNEKQRITEALARVDAQRQKLTGELEELEATERVLARYNKGAQTGKASAKTPPPPSRPPQRDQAGAHALRPQERLAASVARPASAIMFLPWQSARRSGKSLQLAGAFARTMLAPRLPGTSGPVASKSAVGSSMSRSQRGRSNAPRSSIKMKGVPLAEADDHALDRFGVDRVLGGDRHANLFASHWRAQRWTDQLAANRRSNCER